MLLGLGFFSRTLPTKMLPGGWIFVEAKSVMLLVLPPTCNSREELYLFCLHNWEHLPGLQVDASSKVMLQC